MDLFGAAHEWGGWDQKTPEPKVCHTYPTKMELGTIMPYLRRIRFFIGSQQVLLYQKIQIYTVFW